MISIVAALSLGLVVFAEVEPPMKAELAAITARGRDLAGYDQAAWHASDALKTAELKEGAITGYLARKTDKGWVVAFGRLDKSREKYLIAFEASQGKNPETFTITEFDPPKVDTAFFRSAAIGIETALADFTAHFEGEKRPYNVAVLPADEGELWLYLVPAPTKAGVWPLGADIRYRLSADGLKIQSKRQLHKSVIEYSPQKQEAGNQLAAHMHNHILAETPEDTDVFHVLTRKPASPELIVTQHFLFVIEPDGEAKFVRKNGSVPKSP